MQLRSAISFRSGAKTESFLNSLEWNVKVILRVEKMGKKKGAVIFVGDCAKSLFRALVKWKRNIPPLLWGEAAGGFPAYIHLFTFQRPLKPGIG